MSVPKQPTMSQDIAAMAEAAEASGLLTDLQLNLQERGWLLLKRGDDALDGHGAAAHFAAHDEELHRMLEPVLEDLGADLVPLADALPHLRLLPDVGGEE